VPHPQPPIRLRLPDYGRNQNVILRILVLSLVLLLQACSEETVYRSLPAGATVLAFGDSVTYGTGARAGEDWPTLLAQSTGWDVTNAGIPGDTAHNAQHRLPALLSELDPELVIIELGGNDFLRRLPLTGVREALRSMILQVQGGGAIAVLVSVPQFSMLRATVGNYSDSPMYEELAEELGVLLAADVFADVLSDENLRADRIHPNASGYRVFNQELMAYLQVWGLLEGRSD
jgi:acyl-CoA thioesterase-1